MKTADSYRTKLGHGILAVALIALTAGCAEKTSSLAPPKHLIKHDATRLTLSPDQVKDLHLTSATVVSQVIPEELDLVGQIDENSTLSTPVMSLVPGRVEKVNVQLGDHVRKGQYLAEIRSDEVARIEAELLHEFLSLEVDVERTKVKLELAQKARDRQQMLFNEGIGARAVLETAEGEYRMAEAELKAFREKRRSAVETTRERLKLFGIQSHEIDRLLKTRVTDNIFDVPCPRGGVIVAREVDLGQMVDVSHQMFMVSDLTQVWVNAQAFEKDINSIALGEPITLHLESYPGQVFHGKVDYIGSTLDPKTRTLAVRATVANPHLKLHPHMYAQVKLKVGQRTGLLVPTSAVRKTGETYLAYVVSKPGVFEERKIEIGPYKGDKVVIESGLRAGETVVAKGSLELNGLAIKMSSDSEEQ
ncbi:MAG: efflux RND transporter periplasmic adaptor subunit [Candidatus Melainabacteria bacterium]|nr:efflux RND transporter periplasmic adaptor subunit [Candidatus Melainabacteria bacterium]